MKRSSTRKQTHWLKRILRHISARRLSTGVIAALLIIIGSVAVRETFKYGIEASEIGSTITANAEVVFCTIGDTEDVCNPALNKYSHVEKSNILATSVTPPSGTQSACLKIPVQSPRNGLKVRIAVYSGTNLIAQTRTDYTNDQVVITNSDFLAPLNASATYSVHIKVDEHLAKKVTGNPLAAVCLPVTEPLLWGDVAGTTGTGAYAVVGNNIIDPSDIVQIIRGRVINSSYSPVDIVLAIRNRVQHAQGDIE